VRRALALLGLAAALALVGAGAAVDQQRAHDRELSPLASSSNTGPHGLAAARMVLAATGRPAVRLAEPEEAPPPQAVILLAAPRAALGDVDVAALLAHARAGGTLLWMTGLVRQPALERALGLRAFGGGAPRTAIPLAPHPLFAGLELPAGGGSLSGGPPGALAVLGAGGTVAALSIPAGRGEVLVLAGTDALENARLGEGGALSLLTRLAARGRIAFDERWLVPRGGQTSAARAGLVAALLQAALAAALLLAARSRRLGAIRPPPDEGSGRTARDYLTALAALYRRAGARDELARATWARARRTLERRAGIPAHLPPADAAARLARRAPEAAAAFARGEAATRGGKGALLRACRAADDLEHALGGR
jgi:hypothetical protein